MIKPIGPCKDCPDRCEGCHGRCERYQEYAKKIKAWHQMLYEEKLVEREQDAIRRAGTARASARRRRNRAK